MEKSVQIPDTVPLMTLPETVLFPKAMLPLFIFEDRYKHMVSDILKGTRIFAVASLQNEEGGGEKFEPYFDTAGVGLVRACHENEDGTCNLILQGLTRVRILKTIIEDPYRIARIEVLNTITDGESMHLNNLRERLTGAIQLSRDLGSPIPDHVMDFLQKIVTMRFVFSHSGDIFGIDFTPQRTQRISPLCVLYGELNENRHPIQAPPDFYG